MAEPGDVIGTWRLDVLLGEGATGAVWRAHPIAQVDVHVAIKLFLPRSFDESEARFRREAEVLRTLEHPAIVGFRDSGSDAATGLLYLVMDFVPGEDLADRVARGPMDGDAARALFLDLAQGLEHAHARGIFHRDLKPQNIRLRPGGGAVLIDFGIAFQEGAASLTQDGMLPGTIGYFPPEVFARGARPDPRMGDIYALGLLLFEAIEGRAAFATDEDLSTNQQAVRIIADKLARRRLRVTRPAPRDLVDLVDVATDPDPRRRLVSMSAFVERLGGKPLRSMRVSDAPASGTVWMEDEDPLEAPAPPALSTTEAPPETRWFDRDGTRALLEEVAEAEDAPMPAPGPPPISQVSPADPPADAPAVPPPPPPPPSVHTVSPRKGGIVLPGAGGPSRAATSGGPTAPAMGVEGPAPLGGLSAPAAVALGALGTVAVVMLVAALAFVLWMPAADPSGGVPPEPVAPALVDVSLSVDGEPDALWVDGVQAAQVDGRYQALLTPGPHEVVLAKGPACGDGPSACGPCCACVTHGFEVVPGAAALPAWKVPTGDVRERTLEVRPEGDVGGAAVAVWVGGERLPAGSLRAAVVPAEGVAVRVDVGTCEDGAAGCASGTCPVGCHSAVTEVDVACGLDTQVVVVPVRAPRAEPVAQPRTGRATEAPRSSGSRAAAPADEPAGTATPTLGARGTVEAGGIDKGELEQALRGLKPAILGCWENAGSPMTSIGRTKVSFKVKRGGEVDTSSLSLLERTGVTTVDGCVMAGLKGMLVGDKPGKAVATFTFAVE